VEKGGVYLKDAAVFAGLGVLEKNNLLLDQKWGPRIRLRAVLIEGSLPPDRPLKTSIPARTALCHAGKPALKMRSPLGNMTVRAVFNASMPIVPIQ